IMKRVLCTFVLLIGAISAQAPSTSEGKPPQQAPARVFIYQPNRRGFRASPIFCDGLEVASLRHYWTYFVLEVPAGEHSFRGRHKLYELDYRSLNIYTMMVSTILYFQRNTTGAALISSK